MGRKKQDSVRLPGIKQLPSGAWNTKIQIDGRRISITKDTYQECAAEYLALKNGVVKAKKTAGAKCVTLGEAVDRYIARCREDAERGVMSPATVYGYIRYRNNTFQRGMGIDVHKATNQQWQRAIDGEKKLGRSPKYIKNAWGLMSAAIKAETGAAPEVTLYAKEHKERPYLDPEEIDIFVEAVKGQPVEIPALLCLSSLRRSEILALKWENVDLKNKVLYVRGAKVRGEHGMNLKAENKTEKSRRAVPIIPPLHEALKEAPRETEFVVNAATSTLFKHINKICAENGLPLVGMHGLRHSFASLAYHLQIPEMIAAEIGGWADLGTMHKIYTHLAERDIAKKSSAFSDYFGAAEMEKRKSGNGSGNAE